MTACHKKLHFTKQTGRSAWYAKHLLNRYRSRPLRPLCPFPETSSTITITNRFLAMAELRKTQCEGTFPNSSEPCKNAGKYWIYRGDANRITCPLHLARVMAHFTQPAAMWYPEYKVTDMSEVTIRVWNGTSWYPQTSHAKGN